MILIRKGKLHQSHRKYSKSISKKDGLYILSAVRTPFGLHNGSLNKFTAPQLGSFALTEALHRAVVPTEDLKSVFFGCALHENSQKEIISHTGLSGKAKISSLSTCGMESIIEAAKFLQTSSHNVCLAGGTESLSNSLFVDSQKIIELIKTNQNEAKNLLKSYLKSSGDLNKFLQQDYKNFKEGVKNGAFYDEIIKIVFKKKGEIILVAEDDVPKKNEIDMSGFNVAYSPPPGDGAAAIVIASEDYVQKNYLTPLAKIVAFAEEPSTNANNLALAQLLAIEKALKLAQFSCDKISRWEIDSVVSDVVFSCIYHLNLDSSSVNKDGGFLNLGYPVGMSGVRAICHLTHSLPAGELGCAAKCDFNGTASALIIKKLGGTVSEKPLLTLYTKKSCTLCDSLKTKLKPFKDQFLLQEVDIDAEKNKKYRKLYKYEIPVLFMDGRFLCKNQLDVPHFKRRLLNSSNFVTNSSSETFASIPITALQGLSDNIKDKELTTRMQKSVNWT